MSDPLGYLIDSDGLKIVGTDGYCYTPEEYRQEIESEPLIPTPDGPALDVEPEMVHDTEIHREIES